MVNADADTKFILILFLLGAIPGGQDPINVLAKPSDHIEAFFEDTAGLVEGVEEVFYSNKIVMREIGICKAHNSDCDSRFRCYRGNSHFKCRND